MRNSIFLLTFILGMALSPGASPALQQPSSATPTATPSPGSSPTPPPTRAAAGTPAIDNLISYPHDGQALQGNIAIRGSTGAENFQLAELAFAYADHPTETWFLIAQLQEPVSNDDLARWDTTTITDGQYDLRLTVTLRDEERQSYIVKGVRVRNYTPVETDTPAPTGTPEPWELPTSTPTLSATPTHKPATPTPMPTNPAQLTSAEIVTGLGKGALGAALAFLGLGGYLTLKRALRR